MQIATTHLPNDPGVYLFKDAKGTILYIGKAKDLKKRIAQYFSPGSLRKQEMLWKAVTVDFLVVKNESESLYLENNLIKKHKPFYNTMLKGGNGYTYVKLTAHPFPQVLLTRNKKNDKATYIWPKHNTRELKLLLQYLRYVLQFRTCGAMQFKKGKLCSDYYFKLCKGWCTGCPTSDYQVCMKQLISFFKGNTTLIEQEILQQIEKAVSSQHFEWAATLRDIYRHIAQVVERQHVELPKNIQGYVVEIRTIGAWNIFVLLHFYEGKLVDVIREKSPLADGDAYWMLAWFEAEFGDMPPQLQEDNRLLARSEEIKFSGSEQKAVQQMMHHFFDSYLLATSFTGENLYNDLLHTLQTTYHLKNFPYRMECIDISHISGDWTSGGLSCMVGGLLEKKGYRKYKIRSTQGMNNDYAALTEVLTRRFLSPTSSHEGDLLPDVCILDGGKGQLGVVKTLRETDAKFRQIFEKVHFISLGKGKARKKTDIGKRSSRSSTAVIGEKVYLFDEEFHIVEISLTYDQADTLLTKLRDEAHRFSNAYRKQQMKKQREALSASK